MGQMGLACPVLLVADQDGARRSYVDVDFQSFGTVEMALRMALSSMSPVAIGL